jgi:adenosylcobinamide-GDP ribazoletransferase
MNDFIKGIIYGISYFSVLPFGIEKFNTNKKFYKGVIFALPLVGLSLACIISVLFLIFDFVLPNWYAAILVSILYPFLYGFIHLEAVADTIDGWFASYSKKDIYKIMHEPQIGSIGAISTFSFMLLKILALSYLLVNEQFIFILVAFTLSRISIYFALNFEYHNNSTFIISLKNSLKTSTIFKLLLLPINILTKTILNKLKQRLGFLNGDTLGFLIEFTEIILLNIFIAI